MSDTAITAPIATIASLSAHEGQTVILNRREQVSRQIDEKAAALS